MKKVVVLVLSFGLIGSAMGQIAYPTNVFWQFLEGLQAGDSSTLNYLEYKNDFLLLKTDQRDDKVLQVRNELNDIGISTIFIDANGNGGFSIDSSGGQTVIKLRGALSDHSYINNEFVSVGRGGQSQDYGGNVDGAKFTVSSDTREPDYGLWDANNYQMMLQSSKDSLGGYAGLAFTSESAAQDRNVGAFINYRKTGNNGRGELHFGTKTSTTSLADGVHAMKIYDGSVTIDSTIVLPNLATGTSDTVLILDGDVVQKKDISSFADNIYNTDGTLTGDRTLDLDTYDLTFNGGNVGIGTTAPSANLEVAKGGEGLYFKAGGDTANNGRGIEFSSSTNDGRNGALHTINAPSLSGAISLNTASVSRIYMDMLGNVGIGTTSPSQKLEVAGNVLVTTSGSTQPLKTYQDTYKQFSVDYPSTPSAFTTQLNFAVFGRFQYNGNGGHLSIENRSTQVSSSMRFVMGTTERMRITDTGNVGIGTTSPSAKLEVAGNIYPSIGDTYDLGTSSSGNRFNWGYFGSGISSGTSASGLTLKTQAAWPIILSTNNVEKMRIASTGNILINTTTDAGFKLDVNGTARVSGNTTITGNVVCANTIGSISSAVFTGFTMLLGGGTSNATSYLTINGTNSATTGNSFALNSAFTFQPTSGSANSAAFAWSGTINQTGGANGITRGLYINPTLTAAADFRAIETTVGNVILGSTSGNVGIGTTTPSAKIHADNTATTGVGAIIENSNVTNTGDIAQFHNSTGEVASITNDGGAGFGNSSIDASAKVEITSTTKGFLPPRMTGTQAEAISSPAEGLMVYSTDGSGVTITSKGWWGYDGSTWVQLN